MNKKILEKAIKKFEKLSAEYDGFINVIFDNWRGFRFVFDTKDTRKCNNDCKNCELYKLLKKYCVDKNSFGLFPATKSDKKLFGPQKFLNCKTLEQYKKCFIDYILEKIKSEKELKKELFLVKNFRIIFSKNKKGARALERETKRQILKSVSRRQDYFIMRQG